MKFTNAESKCISHVCIPDNYDKTIEPFQNEITNISVQYSEIKVVKVDDEESTITLSLSLSLIWMDPRLNVDVSLKNKTLTILSTAIMDKIWIPTSYMIVDLKQRKPMVRWFSVLNQKYFIATYGIEIVLQCAMTFDDYPLDSQICYLKLMSKDLETKTSFKTFKIKPLKDNKSSKHNHHHTELNNLLDYEVKFNNLTKKHSFLELDRGKMITMSGFEIRLRRKRNKYIIYYYFPSGLITSISCVSI